MSKDILVLTPNGRRQKVHCTPDTSILQVLEDVCAKQGFRPTEYDLKHYNHVLDPTTTIRWANLPNKATLEMVEAERTRQETNVTIGLLLEDGERRTGDFSPITTLFDLANTLAPAELSSLTHPTILYMRQEVTGENALRDKTLRQMGLIGGRAVLRLLNKAEEGMQANVSAVYRRPLPARDEPNRNREPTPTREETTNSGAHKKVHPEAFDSIDLIKKKKGKKTQAKCKEEKPVHIQDSDDKLPIQEDSMPMEVDNLGGNLKRASSNTSCMSQENLERRLKIEEEVTFTWMPPHTPCVATPEAATPRASSPQPGPSGTARSGPRRKLPVSDSQIELMLGDSGSEDDDVFGSSDEDEPMPDPANMRFVAHRLREVAIMQAERQDAALAAFLAEDNVAMEEVPGIDAVSVVLEPSDVDGGEAQVGEVAGPSPPSSFSWSGDFSTFSGEAEEYTRNPGPNVNIGANAIDIFSLIFDVTILTQIVLQTNKYAWEVIVDLTERGILPKYLDLWVETTVEEIRKFFGVIIYMSLNSRARIDEYWTTGVLGMPNFRAIMSRNRFQMLLRFLHFADNNDISPLLTTYEKRIAKIAPIFHYINEKFSSLYTPQRELSLDESLLLWKGRLSWVQCIRSKAARFGIKTFELCEAASGYLLRSVLYAGKNSTFVQGDIHGFDNKTAKVVLELMDGYLDVGHEVVMDNWYNQVPLTRFLKSRRTDVLGTLNRNRKEIPDIIKNANNRQMRRFDQVSQHCGDISITTWKDVKLVTVISTSHNNDQVLGRRDGQPLMKPVAIEAYNKNMGGVDLKDTKLSAYLMERKRGRKWYRKVFFRLLNTSILNAFILYQKNPVTKVLTHRDFRYHLAEALVATQFQSAVPREPRLLIPQVVERLDGQGHLVAYGPGTARPRCVWCKSKGKRAQVRNICVKCKVPLCIECFVEYHTLP